ncbi:MAG: ABC transporter ATP-binding protein [Solirubrobacterales bacterium]
MAGKRTRSAATPKRRRRRTTSAKPALEARELAKSYGDREALRGVSFEVAPGELLAVVGPNGAGKTTLLGILAGITEPDAGEVVVATGEVGWVPQQAALYRRLTVAENLRLFARLERGGDPDAAVARMLDQTGLEDRRDDQVSDLSGGNQQRVNIAIGLLAEPAVLLLDEPSAGLDPDQRIRLWEFVAGLAGEGTTVVYSTHQIEEAARYGDRLLVLADGEALFDGSFDAMRRASAPGRRRRDPEADFVRFLRRRGH